MLLPYFLTSLKPIDLMAPPPMSSADFIQLSEDCLSTDIAADLERLHAMTRINCAPLNETIIDPTASFDFAMPQQALADPLSRRYLYWLWLKQACMADFIGRYADSAVRLYQILAHLLASKSGLTSHEPSSTNTLGAWLQDDAFIADGEVLARHHAYVRLEHALMDKNPAALENAVSNELIAIVDELVDDDPFSVDHVFAYFIKLMRCERNASLTQERGNAVLASILSMVSEGAHDGRA